MATLPKGGEAFPPLDLAAMDASQAWENISEGYDMESWCSHLEPSQGTICEEGPPKISLSMHTSPLLW